MPETPENAIYNTYSSQFRQEIGGMLLEPDFQADAVTTRLEASLDTVTPGIIETTYRHEDVWRYPEYQPLRQHLGKLAVHESELAEMQPSNDFVEDLRAQIKNLPYDFSQLEDYHQQMSQTGYLSLAKEVRELADDAGKGWADTAYSKVEDAVKIPDKYSLPLGDAEALYLVCFLSGRERPLTRRVIVNNFIYDSVAEQVGPDLNDDEQTVLTELRKVLNAEALVGQQWTDRPITESTQKKISMHGLGMLESLGAVQKLIQSDKGTKVADAWWEVSQTLTDRLDNAVKDSPIRSWQSEDIGHCFNGFISYDLMAAFQKGMYESRGPEINPKKDGSKAVILEDDPEQMDAWVGAVTRHTPQTIDGELCFTSPEGVLEAAEDMNSRLFLIDIQNGTDNTAGIRIGEDILNKRLQHVDNLDVKEIKKLELTKIVVWTASQELYAIASDYFKPKLQELSRAGKPLAYYVIGTGSSGGSPPIRFEVALKGFDVGDLDRMK